jgi:bla regulator protein BlaR1
MIRLLAAMALVAPAAFAGEDSWVVVRGERGATMHGDLADLKVARRYLKDSGPAYLWFRHDGREYVVRDGTAIQKIDDLVRPQEELGEEQARLGKHQARLGQQQADLGMRQARAALRGDHDEERELGKAQESLGREQEKIGREQEKMGKRQEKLAREVEQKVALLIDRTLKDGTAKPVR